MCYSAMVVARFKKLNRRVPTAPDLAAFEKLYEQRLIDASLKIPRALDANFDDPQSPAEGRIRELIMECRKQRAAVLEAELFKQKKRQADAQRALQAKVTKKAQDDLRISTEKIERHVAWLRDLQRAEPKASDSRIFPFWYAPVIVREGSEFVIRPMRYHCRPMGKPASYDRQYDGLYNARRDNLERFWKNLYGEHHAVVVMTGFYENVARHDFERRELQPGEKEENLVLHFNPQPEQEMYVACLWSRWEGQGQEPLESFAAITDGPPPEVAATGHDRCVIQLQEENVAEWLAPAGAPRERLVQILDDKARPYYEHRLAA
jgi:putative SOS response-associated peptidase YedK